MGSRTLIDGNASFHTTGDGLAGSYVTIIAGTGVGQTRRIISNTATVLTLESIWTTLPSSDSVYHVGNINFNCKSAELDGTKFGFRANSTLNFNKMIIECAQQAETYLTGRAILTYNSTSVTGSGTTWTTASHRAKNFYIPGYPAYEHFISSVGSTTALTLTSAWQGQTGNYAYKIGAKLLKISFYLNGSSTAYRTVYADMASSPISVPIACKAKSLQYQISNNRTDEPVTIYSITIQEPTLYVQ